MGNGFFYEIWRYRELVYFFAWRDVKIRYKQAVLGAAWAVLQPLSAMVVFTVLLGRLAGVPSDDLPYPVFAYAGLVMWSYFSGVMLMAGQCLTGNSNLVTKVYFPRVTLPASNAVSGLLDFATSMSLLVGLMIWYGIVPSWHVLLAPVFVLGMVIFTLGVSLWLSALTVWYRDIKHTLPLAVQLGMFATPVVYPASYLPAKVQPYMFLNPMAGFIDGFRDCLLLARWPNPLHTGVSFAVALAVFGLGWAYFHRAERSFADII